VRLSEWPRMPILNEEVREWIGVELQSLGVEDLAVYALEAGREGDERRVMVATEIGLLDHRYAPFGSSARYRLAMLLYPWQVLRGVELRADTFRLWAMEHRTRWSFKLHHPHFEVATESPELGQALCDLARVCSVMAEPFGVPAGRPTAQPAPTAPAGTSARGPSRSTHASLEVGGRARSGAAATTAAAATTGTAATTSDESPAPEGEGASPAESTTSEPVPASTEATVDWEPDAEDG